MSTLREIEAAVLRLPERERLQLADTLLGSLPAPPSATDADDILAEAIRREGEMESGAVKPVSESEFWQGGRRQG